jgi:hypothetical protein
MDGSEEPLYADAIPAAGKLQRGRLRRAVVSCAVP